MFDSIAAGVPIIQNTNGWMAKLINDNKMGVNIKDKRPIEYFKLIVSLNNEIAENHRKGILLNQEKYSIESISMDYLNFVSESLK